MAIESDVEIDVAEGSFALVGEDDWDLEFAEDPGPGAVAGLTQSQSGLVLFTGLSSGRVRLVLQTHVEPPGLRPDAEGVEEVSLTVGGALLAESPTVVSDLEAPVWESPSPGTYRIRVSVVGRGRNAGLNVSSLEGSPAETYWVDAWAEPAARDAQLLRDDGHRLS